MAVICPTAQGDGMRQINATGKITPLDRDAPGRQIKTRHAGLDPGIHAFPFAPAKEWMAWPSPRRSPATTLWCSPAELR